MTSCKEIALSLSAREIDRQSRMQRMALLVHLAMCRHCRAFNRQLRRFTHLARLASEPRDLPHDFESTLVSRLAR
jgi:predicted anti-sigma-YlaC factor YlaD